MFNATTTGSILRGEGVDIYGDTTNIDNVVHSKVPVAITPQRKTVYLPDSGEYRTVRMFMGRVNPTLGVIKGDRLRDERTDIIYIVDEVTYTTGYAQQSTCMLDLRQV